MSFAAAADATNISARKKKALDFVNKVKQESEMRNKETKVKKEEPEVKEETEAKEETKVGVERS